MKNIKENDIIWFEEYWTGRPVVTKVKNIVNDGKIIVTKMDAELRTKYDLLDIAPGSTRIHIDGVFKTQEECLQYINNKNNNKKEQYKLEIKTKDDLIRFLFENTCSSAEEYTDYNARAAAIEKAKEFGIDLQ